MEDELAGGFGVRRPLRFLAHRLGLDEPQVAALARILDELKTDRAQAEVDRRRTLATFADALSGRGVRRRQGRRGGRTAGEERSASARPCSRRFGRFTRSCGRTSASNWRT